MIATPGRLLDYLDAQLLSLMNVTYLVLDEADLMLDMGFSNQIEQIVSQIRPDRQTLMFSATWIHQVQDVAKKHLKNPFLVFIGSIETSANPNVKQEFIFVRDIDKLQRFVVWLQSIT